MRRNVHQQNNMNQTSTYFFSSQNVLHIYESGKSELPFSLNLLNASRTEQLTVIGRGGQNIVICQWGADQLLS